MPTQTSQNGALYLLLEEIMHQHMLQTLIVVMLLFRITTKKRKRVNQNEYYSIIQRMHTQVQHLDRLIGATDTDCIVNLRMDRNSFGRLCIMLQDVGGLCDGKFVSVPEQVAMFLGILAHHKKNRVVRFDFWRSGQTISHYTHLVLKALLRYYGILLVNISDGTIRVTEPEVLRVDDSDDDEVTSPILRRRLFDDRESSNR